MTDIAIRFRDSLALSRNQKLLPHFGEAGTAVFAVEEIEYSWHDRPLSFDRHHQFSRYHLSWDARRDLDYSPSCFGMTSRFLGTASLIANDPLELHRKQVIKAVAMPGGVKPPLPVVGREPRR